MSGAVNARAADAIVELIEFDVVVVVRGLAEVRLQTWLAKLCAEDQAVAGMHILGNSGCSRHARNLHSS